MIEGIVYLKEKRRDTHFNVQTVQRRCVSWRLLVVVV
jgi:hypothetical protein